MARHMPRRNNDHVGSLTFIIPCHIASFSLQHGARECDNLERQKKIITANSQVFSCTHLPQEKRQDKAEHKLPKKKMKENIFFSEVFQCEKLM